MKKAFLKYSAPAAAFLTTVVTAVSAHAAAMVDYSGIGTSITAEIGPALTAVVPIAGTLLAAGLGWKFAKRFLK